MRRWWFSRARWWLPALSSDEYGRRTLVLPLVPGLLVLVIALWTCKCDDCERSRRQTAADEADAALEDFGNWLLRHQVMQEMPKP
jgi:hypothetical protein